MNHLMKIGGMLPIKIQELADQGMIDIFAKF